MQKHVFILFSPVFFRDFIPFAPSLSHFLKPVFFFHLIIFSSVIMKGHGYSCAVKRDSYGT